MVRQTGPGRHLQPARPDRVVSSWVAVAVCWKRDINHAQARPGQPLANRTSATEKPSRGMFALARLESPVRRPTASYRDLARGDLDQLQVVVQVDRLRLRANAPTQGRTTARPHERRDAQPARNRDVTPCHSRRPARMRCERSTPAAARVTPVSESCDGP
jgi:hypothetical protein